MSDVEFFIEEGWLNAVRGMDFFYPCAGNDLIDPLQAFAFVADRMVFNDPYRIKLPSNLEARTGWSLRLANSRANKQDYVIVQQSEKCSVELTTEFGQVALQEFFEDGRIGIFWHRADSIGEGGSNLWFWKDELQSEWLQGPPVEGLMGKLKAKLANNALVVTDGSLNPFSFTHTNTNQRSGKDMYQDLQGKVYIAAGYEWRVVGWVPRRRWTTLVWGIVRQ